MMNLLDERINRHQSRIKQYGTDRCVPYSMDQCHGIANTIVQLIRRLASGVIAPAKYLTKGWQRHAGSDLETSRETRRADNAERLTRQRLRVSEAAQRATDRRTTCA